MGPVQASTERVDRPSTPRDPWCWWCRLPIAPGTDFWTSPLRRRRDRHAFEVEGWFCSVRCAKAHFAESPAGRQTPELFAELYGTRIAPAPHWQALDVYGGHMTPAEYRHMLGEGVRTVRRTEPPMMTWTTELVTELLETRRANAVKAERESLARSAAVRDEPFQRSPAPVARRGRTLKPEMPLSTERRPPKMARHLPASSPMMGLRAFALGPPVKPEPGVKMEPG